MGVVEVEAGGGEGRCVERECNGRGHGVFMGVE